MLQLEGAPAGGLCELPPRAALRSLISLPPQLQFGCCVWAGSFTVTHWLHAPQYRHWLGAPRARLASLCKPVKSALYLCSGA